MSRWKLRALIVLATMGAGLSEAGAQDDPLPPGALWRQGTTRLRHPGGVNSLAFAPAGKLVASGGDGAVRLWDSATGKELAFCYPGDFRIYQLAFAPDGQTLAMGTGDGIFLYDVAARRLRRHSEHEALTVSFSRDGRFLAGSGSSVSLWDLRAGKKLQQTPADSSLIYGMTIAPDGKSLVYARTNAGNKPGETDLQQWDIAAAKETRRLAGPKDWIHALRFSPDGKTIAAAAHSEVLIVDADTWTYRVRLQRQVRDLAFCPKTQRLAIATDSDVELCNITTGKIEQTLAKQPNDFRRRRCVAVSGDGATLATGDSHGQIRLWDITTGAEKLAQPDAVNEVTGLVFAPDGATLASCFRDGRIQLFDAKTGRPGKLLAERIPHVDLSDKCPSSLVFSQDGRVLAVADRTGHIGVWDPAAGKEIRHWPTPDRSTQVDLTPDGKLMAAGSTSSGVESLKLWDVGDGKPIRELNYTGPRGDKRRFTLGFGGPVFSPDGKFVAAVAKPYEHITGSIRIVEAEQPPPPASIQIWDMASGKPVAGEGLRDTRLYYATQVLFFPDGKMLATAGNPILLWDRGAGHVCRSFVHPAGSQTGAMALSADGRWLAAACVLRGAAGTPQTWRHVVCVWETASGKIAWQRANHRGKIAAIAFAPGGRTLASGGADATIILWDLAPPAEPGARLPNVLSPKERAALWDALAAPDADAAYAAIHELESRPDQAVVLFGDKLRPDAPLPVGQWLADLDVKEFARRDKARLALLDLGREALPHVLGLDEKKLSLEGQRRRQHLLRDLPERPYSLQQLQQIRAIAVLERIAAPEARRILDVIAQGRQGSPQTEHAQAARARLDGKPRPGSPQ